MNTKNLLLGLSLCCLNLTGFSQLIRTDSAITIDYPFHYEKTKIVYDDDFFDKKKGESGFISLISNFITLTGEEYRDTIDESSSDVTRFYYPASDMMYYQLQHEDENIAILFFGVDGKQKDKRTFLKKDYCFITYHNKIWHSPPYSAYNYLIIQHE